MKNTEINAEVLRKWEGTDFPFEVKFSERELKKHSTFKSGLSFKEGTPVEDVAKNLVNQMETLLKETGQKSSSFTGYTTAESIVAPIMGLGEINRFVTAYVAVHISSETNEQVGDSVAWMVLNGNFENQKDTGEYIIKDGEKVPVTWKYL